MGDNGENQQKITYYITLISESRDAKTLNKIFQTYLHLIASLGSLPDFEMRKKKNFIKLKIRTSVENIYIFSEANKKFDGKIDRICEKII